MNRKILATDRILAIDPGKTTGFASYYNEVAATPTRAWQLQPTHDSLIQELNDFYPDIIVCENFVHTQRSKVDYTPVEYIGLIKWYVSRRDVELVLQTPAFGKGFFSDDKLKRMNIYIPGKPHAMDATRHLYQFLMKHGLLDLNILK